jgi:hypothetical protein
MVWHVHIVMVAHAHRNSIFYNYHLSTHRNSISYNDHLSKVAQVCWDTAFAFKYILHISKCKSKVCVESYKMSREHLNSISMVGICQGQHLLPFTLHLENTSCY